VHGSRIAELQVSKPAAIHIYERLGFTRVSSSTRFRGARRDVAAALECRDAQLSARAPAARDRSDRTPSDQSGSASEKALTRRGRT
jgi:hypothetical protein